MLSQLRTLVFVKARQTAELVLNYRPECFLLILFFRLRSQKSGVHAVDVRLARF